MFVIPPTDPLSFHDLSKNGKFPEIACCVPRPHRLCPCVLNVAFRLTVTRARPASEADADGMVAAPMAMTSDIDTRTMRTRRDIRTSSPLRRLPPEPQLRSN